MKCQANSLDMTKSAKALEDTLLSVVVPCFDESDVIRLTYEELTNTLGNSAFALELIFVNDGSTDDTLQQLREIARSDERVKVISLSRNFGHQLALTAGLDHAAGDMVAVIDADLQDPPAVILDMIEKWQQGYKVVYGQRTDRGGETPFKILTAKYYYRLLGYLSEIEIPQDTGDFRLIDRSIVDALKNMPEKDRFLRGMISWAGFRQTAVPYRRMPRAVQGPTKYPMGKMLSFATSGILGFSSKPLRIATATGLGIFLLAILGILYTFGLWLISGTWVSGWTFIVLAIFFIGGIQLIFLGLIGEYIARIYDENKNRPHYLVEAQIGFSEAPSRRCDE